MSGNTVIMLLEGLDLGKIIGTPTPLPTVGDTSDPIPQGLSSYDSVWQLVGLIALLIIILVAAYYTSRFIGGIKLGQMRKSNFQVIDSYRVTPNKVLQIVKIGNKYVVIAIGKDDIHFITELDEAEVIIRESHQVEKQSFKQILDKLKNNNE
jgi:flagellar protein FliO/FliZ